MMESIAYGILVVMGIYVIDWILLPNVLWGFIQDNKLETWNVITVLYLIGLIGLLVAGIIVMVLVYSASLVVIAIGISPIIIGYISEYINRGKD